MHLTKREKETLAFLQSFMAENPEPPSLTRIAHGIGIESISPISRYVKKLRQAGLTEYKAPGKQYKSPFEEVYDVKQIENKPVQKVMDSLRSGVHELSCEEIEQKAYTVDLMTARLPDGMKWQFLFTVDHHRGYDEYERIK